MINFIDLAPFMQKKMQHALGRLFTSVSLCKYKSLSFAKKKKRGCYAISCRDLFRYFHLI